MICNDVEKWRNASARKNLLKDSMNSYLVKTEKSEDLDKFRILGEEKHEWGLNPSSNDEKQSFQFCLWVTHVITASVCVLLSMQKK